MQTGRQKENDSDKYYVHFPHRQIKSRRSRDHKPSMKKLRSFSIVASLSLLGNILGYARDAALASNFAPTETDAYFAAFFVPNTLYLIFLSGSIATVFLPVFVQYLKKNEIEAWRIASILFNSIFVFLATMVAIAGLTIHYWMPALFPGFNEHTTQLTNTLTLILLPMLLFIGLSNLLSNILYSFEHFTLPALAPVVANIFVISVILIAGYWGNIRWVAIGVTLSMLLQFVIQIPTLIKLKVRYTLTLDIRHPAFIRILRLALPMIVYFVIAYASLAVERNVASSFTTGTVSAVNYATRLFSIPVAFFAGSLGTVIYPRLSLEVANESSNAFSDNLIKAIGATTLFLLPLTLFLLINSYTIVNLLFGYGRFTSESLSLTTGIFRGYLIGMVAAGITRIVQRAFYALQETSILLVAEIANFPVYVVVVFLLSRLLGPTGLGISRGLSYMLVGVLSTLMLVRRREIEFSLIRVISIVGHYLLAGLFAAIVWAGLAWISKDFVTVTGRIVDMSLLMLTGTIGVIVYLVVANYLRLEEIQFVRRRWRSILKLFSS